MALKLVIDRLVSLVTAWRAMGERPVLVVCIGLAVALLLLVRLDARPVHMAADMLGERMVPLVVLAREPVAWSRRLGEQVGDLFAVHAENQRLREENRRLLDWQARAVRLGVENRSLRTMLNMPEPEPRGDWVTARIVADATGPFVHTRLIDVGATAEISPGMAVMTPLGMIGRVIAVGERSSRILLITDLNSKIPVIVERSGDQALLAGDNTAEPKLQFLPMTARLLVGDRVITSGRGGVLPPGLMIGEVSQVDGSRVTVRPAVDWNGIDFIAVLRKAPLPPPESGDGGQSFEPRAPAIAAGQGRIGIAAVGAAVGG